MLKLKMKFGKGWGGWPLAGIGKGMGVY